MKWTKQKLISSFRDLEQRLGGRPTAEQFYSDAKTPSNMPIRQRFGNWTNFMLAMGLEPTKPAFSKKARENSIKARKGKRSFGWKGGRHIDIGGYVMIYRPEHPNATKKGYIGEHRLVMSEYLERPLKPEENVHHINGDRTDNDISNLELWSKAQPSGQRVSDKLEWAIKFLKEYGYEIN